MNYRVLGRTGFKVSELGLGGHEYARFLNPVHYPGERKAEEEVSPEELSASQGPRNELIERAIDAGVNYFDTGLVEEAQSLGLALKTLGRRKDVHIAAETLWPVRRLKDIPKPKWRDAVSEWVNLRLRVLQIDHIDVFNVHMPEDNYSRERFEGIIEGLKETKDEGRISAIGAASHELRFLAELIRKYDCFDSIMIPYNYHRQEAREVLFPLCKALNVGVVIMKSFCWPYYGISFVYFCPPDLEMGGYTPSQLSLRWILSSPEVSTIAPGTNTMKELEENLATFTKEEKMDEGVLKQCLEIALSPKGKQKLRELRQDEEIARTRAYIRGYAERALQAGAGIY
jgi:aryl-alcohol dehydrogenase-like predicted oxidoreductase